MVDFQNGSLLKLKMVPKEKVEDSFLQLLINGEYIISAYKSVRDTVVFTDKRIISLNVQGVTGKRKDYASLPYRRISAFSVETSGVFDIDSELEVWFAGVGKVRFEFTGRCDVSEISRIIAEKSLV